jgi:hypothetical protein
MRLPAGRASSKEKQGIEWTLPGPSMPAATYSAQPQAVLRGKCSAKWPSGASIVDDIRIERRRQRAEFHRTFLDCLLPFQTEREVTQKQAAYHHPPMLPTPVNAEGVRGLLLVNATRRPLLQCKRSPAIAVLASQTQHWRVGDKFSGILGGMRGPD